MQDNIVKLITNHLNNSGTVAEKEELLSWLEESEENKRFYSLFVANYSLHETVTSENLNEDIDCMLGRLGARIDAHEAGRRKMPGNWFFAAVAVCAAALALFLFLPQKTEHAGAPQPVMAVAGNVTGETVHVKLEDGTQVYLRPGARISYNVAGIPDKRLVNLEGDAYFDVARDEQRPFLVNTQNIGVRVLGTSFSVSSSPEVSQVVLERGSVRLLSPEGASMVTLSPNQKATYIGVTGDVRVESIYATAFVTDKYSLVAMSDATLDEIVSSLSDMFKVKIKFSSGDTKKRYNLAFMKSDSIEDVLAIVQYMSGAECTIQHK